MNRWIVGLGGLLIAQIVLAVLLNTGKDPYAAFTPEEKLAAFEPALVDTIHIQAPDRQVTLKKSEGKWKVPELDDFPADQQKVERLLDALAKLKKGWPVATTPSAAKRFKVATDEFERHLTLHQGEKKLADLYFGTSPGFRKVHARTAGENDIVSVPFALFDAEAERDRWIDRKILGLDEKKMTRIELPGITLERKEGEWQLADMKPNQQTVTSEADKLAGKLAGITIESVFGDEAKPEQDEKAKPLKASVTLEEGKKLDYTFRKLKNGSYLLQRSDWNKRFKVAEWEVRPLQEAKREKLVEQKPAEPDEPENSGGSEESENSTPPETPPNNTPRK